MAPTTKALTPNKPLHDLLRSVEPKYCFHPAVEELLLEMASQFVEDVVEFSGKVAKHRRSTVVDAKDLQFCLAKNYGISLAGALNTTGNASTSSTDMGSSDADSSFIGLMARSRPAKNSIHMHRMALKRKTLMRTKEKLMKNTAKISGTSSSSKKSASSSGLSSKKSSSSSK